MDWDVGGSGEEKEGDINISVSPGSRAHLCIRLESLQHLMSLNRLHSSMRHVMADTIDY